MKKLSLFSLLIASHALYAAKLNTNLSPFATAQNIDVPQEKAIPPLAMQHLNSTTPNGEKKRLQMTQSILGKSVDTSNSSDHQPNTKEGQLIALQVALKNKDKQLKSTKLKLDQLENELNNLKVALKKKEDIMKEYQKQVQQAVNNNNLNTIKEKSQSKHQYKGKPLPQDLSGQDLSGFDFTGCYFGYTNLTDTNLDRTILAYTTCDYQYTFQNNIREHGMYWDFYQEEIAKDLKSIAYTYPKLNNNPNKARLLQIASGLARLPFYESREFFIKVQYWSSALLNLKQKLDSFYDKQLSCSLAYRLKSDATYYCWQTKYPQKKITIHTPAPHANFDQYLEDFTNGLIQYKCQSKHSWGFDYYKKEIERNIKGLQKIYSTIKDEKLQQEICHIAHALSKSYQIQDLLFLYHYLFYQNLLIKLKDLVEVGAKNHIYYNISLTRICKKSWDSVLHNMHENAKK